MAIKKIPKDTAADWVKPVVMYLTKNAEGRRKRLDVLEQLGVGTEFFTCYLCGEIKQKEDFYVSSDSRSQTGITRICKACAKRIATPEDLDTGKPKTATPQSLREAMEYLDKPFLNEAYQQAVGAAKKDESNLYEKFILYTTIYGQEKRYCQSDMFANETNREAFFNEGEMPKDESVLDQFEKNKADVIRLIGYEPFQEERISDQPFLYSLLVGFLDASEDANEDMMRVQASISIVRGFLQMSNIDNRIAALMADTTNADKNTSTIKALQAAKRDLSSIITQMAAENCISLKNNRNAVKGENTWTGKMKKLKEMNLRAAENNAFDIETAEGMRQVADISNASIIKQLSLDESDYTDMLVEQRKMLTDLQRRVAVAEEKARLLLRENLDMKEYMNQKELPFEQFEVADRVLDGDFDVPDPEGV